MDVTIAVCGAASSTSALLMPLGFDDAPAHVNRQVTAFLEECPQHPSATLHTRLHARQRDAGHFSGFLLREALKLGERNGFSIGIRQARHERRHAVQERAFLIRWRLGLGDVLEVSSRRSARPKPINHCIPGDAVDPRTEACLIIEMRRAFEDSQQHFLSNVLGIFGWQPPANERSQPIGQQLPGPASSRVKHQCLSNRMTWLPFRSNHRPKDGRLEPLPQPRTLLHRCQGSSP